MATETQGRSQRATKADIERVLAAVEAGQNADAELIAVTKELAENVSALNAQNKSMSDAIAVLQNQNKMLIECAAQTQVDGRWTRWILGVGIPLAAAGLFCIAVIL